VAISAHDIGARLRSARESLALTQIAMAQKLAISHGAIKRLEGGGNVPNGETLLKYAGIGFNPGWALTGIGEMRLPEPSQAGLAQAGDELISFEGSYHQLQRPEPDSSDVVPPSREEFAFLPRYAGAAAAGYGRTAEAEEITEMLAFRRDWLRRIGINPAQAFLLVADGDSMTPTIPDGALMLVDGSIKEPRDIKNGNIYVIVRSGTVIVKRVQFRIDDSVVLISDNAMYERETISREEMNDLHFAGRVVWIGRSI